MKPVVISISPNTEKDDILLSLRVLLSPWKWFDEKAVSDINLDDIAKLLGGK